MKRKALSIILILLILLAIPPMSACYDSLDVDDIAFVMSIGFDKGEKERFRFTFQTPVLADASGEGKNTESAVLISIEANNLEDAINMANVSLPKRLSTISTKYMIFSEEIARTDEFFIFIEDMIDSNNISNATDIFISKCDAGEFLEGMKGDLISNLPKMQRNMLLEPENSGLFCKCTLVNAYEGLTGKGSDAVIALCDINKDAIAGEEQEKSADSDKSGGGMAVSGMDEEEKGMQKGKEQQDAEDETENTEEADAVKDDGSNGNAEGNVDDNIGDRFAGQLIRKGGLGIEILGSAVFLDGKIADTLNGKDTRLLLMLKGDFNRGIFDFINKKDIRREFGMEIRQFRKPKLDIDLSEAVPKIECKLFLRGFATEDIVELNDAGRRKELEEDVERELLMDIDALMKRLQATGSDAADFANGVKKNFLTNAEWDAYDWKSMYQKAEIDIDMDFNMVKSNLT